MKEFSREESRNIIIVCFLLILFELAVIVYKVFTNYTINGDLINTVLFWEILSPVLLIFFQSAVIVTRKKLDYEKDKKDLL